MKINQKIKKVAFIGMGLINSSLARDLKIKKFYLSSSAYSRRLSTINKIKKLKLPGTIIKSLKDGVEKSDLIIFCTPMSEYKKLILKINKFILPKTLITDIGSSKIESSKIIKKFFQFKLNVFR